MMGSLLTRALVMALGYAYPGYKCFKCVELRQPDVEQLKFWCQYWILLALVAVLERVGDTFVSWLPFYNEAKLAFIVYLWAPKTMGTVYMYSSFLRPLVTMHEVEIDRNLNELSTKAGDMAYQYWQKGSVYAQSKVMDLIQTTISQASRAQQGTAEANDQVRQRRWSWKRPESDHQYIQSMTTDHDMQNKVK